MGDINPGLGWDFPPFFTWDWDGTGFFVVGVGRERFKNQLLCYPQTQLQEQKISCSKYYLNACLHLVYKESQMRR